MVRNALLGPKRIFFDRIFERSYWTWRRHPAIIVPSMLWAGLMLIMQSVVVTAVMSFESSWAFNGTLSTALSDYRDNGLLGLIQNPSFSFWLIIGIIVVAVSLIIVALIGGGYVYSSEYGMYIEAWNSRSVPIGDVLVNGSRRWRSMSWTLLLSTLITWGPAAIGYAAVALSLLASNSQAGLTSLIVAGNLLQPLLYASLIIAIFTVYSLPAVAVSGLSGLQAVRRSFDVAGHHLGITLTYSITRILLFIPLLLVRLFPDTLAMPAGIPLTSLAVVVVSFVFTPILHMTKTMVFYYAGPSIPEMPMQPSARIWNDVIREIPAAVWAKIRLGLGETVKFLLGPRNLPFHLVSISAFVAGISLGYYVSSNGWASFLLSIGYQPGHGNSLLNKVAPPALGADIFLNNWYVSVSTALSGIGFGAPSFIAILYTGFTVGRLAVPSLTPSLTMFLAAILPHGVIEIPSFVLAGSMGLRLGYAALKARFAPQPDNPDYLSNILRSTVYIVVGLALLFLIAGLIEADITPIIMRLFGWTF